MMANLFEPPPMDEVKQELTERAKENRNPFLYTVFEEVAPVIVQWLKEKLSA